MKTTTNYGLKKPETNDHYNIGDFNESFDTIDTTLKTLSDKANTATSHIANKSNPHGVTKSQVGLANVPNVSTNDQTPTYTVASANAALSSGEKLSVAFGKIAKAVSSLISHLADNVSHITAAERTSWNAKVDASGTVAKATDADMVDGKHADDFAYRTELNSYRLVNYEGDSEEELNNVYNNLHENAAADGTLYRARVYSDVVHPILSGGERYVEGFKSGEKYGWQISIGHWNNDKLKRTMRAGVWSDWVSISDGGDADTLDGKHASDFSPYVYVKNTFDASVTLEDKIKSYVDELPAGDKIYNVIFNFGTSNVLIIQKYSMHEYASVLCFGYNQASPFYLRKNNGTWIKKNLCDG